MLEEPATSIIKVAMPLLNRIWRQQAVYLYFMILEAINFSSSCQKSIQQRKLRKPWLLLGLAIKMLPEVDQDSV
jgi:hypothetical protein